jgi:hypothetical protein
MRVVVAHGTASGFVELSKVARVAPLPCVARQGLGKPGTLAQAACKLPLTGRTIPLDPRSAFIEQVLAH